MSAPAAAASSSSADVDAPDVDEQKQNLSKEQAAEAGQLDKVTDFAEEVEMDEAKSQQMLTNLTASTESAESARLAKELASVQVNADEVEMLARELEVSAEEAEKMIRVARGDVKLAITNALK